MVTKEQLPTSRGDDLLHRHSGLLQAVDGEASR